MIRLISRKFCPALSLLLSLTGACTYAQDSGALTAAITVGMQCEARGDMMGASKQYMNICKAGAQSPYGRVPVDTMRLLCRRSLACLIKMSGQQAAQADKRWSPAQSLYSRILDGYRTMYKLEPANASWPYLAGESFANHRSYLAAEAYLKLASNPARGPEAVRHKAQALLNKLAPQIAQAHREDEAAAARLQAEIDRPLDWFDPSDVMRYATPTSDSGSGNGSSSWEGRQNAERAGDWGAADRFRSGSGTWSDTHNYGSR